MRGQFHDVPTSHCLLLEAALALGEPTEWSLPVGLVAGALSTVVGLAGLAWRASATASMHVTLGLPVVSSQPCVLMLALLLLSACAAATVGRRALARAVAR